MRARSLRIVGKAVFYSAATLAAIYFGSGLLVGWLLVRPGRRRDYDCIPNVRYGRMEPLTLHSADGLRLHAWALLSRKAAPEDWVVVLHGYRSDRCAVQNRARFFSRRGFNVLLLHFRGHGSSEAALISYGYRERKDVKAAFDFIRSLRPDARMRIGIDGISMGAAAAAYGVGHGEIDPDWMILESCYDNIRNAFTNRMSRQVGESLTPLLAWPVEIVVERLSELRADDLDPGKHLEKAKCPILVLAGDSEAVLKLVEIEYFYGCIPEPKRLVLFPGGGHGDLLASDPKRFARQVGKFLLDFARRPKPELPEKEKSAVEEPDLAPLAVEK